MKILRFNSTHNEVKQIVMLAMTMQTINIKGNGQTSVKELPVAMSKNWKLLHEKDYAIQYPQDWCLDKPGKMGSNFIIFSKPNSSKDLFNDNVNLMVQDLKGERINLDKFVETSENQIKTELENWKILESRRLCNDICDYHKIVYTGNKGIFQFKFLQYYMIKKEKAYILTLTCEINEFEKHIVTAQKIMNSFELQ